MEGELKLMSKTTVLITGGAGFIGANFLNYFIGKHDEYKVINLDNLTYAAEIKNLNDFNNENYQFVQGDITDTNLVKSVLHEYNVKHIIHFAAESHVDNSIASPESFIKTNILGTFNLIDQARSMWMEKPHQYKAEYTGSRFHHISTDEVYGSLGETGYFTEKTPYAPNSPYSASKASSDFLVRSYFHTYGMNVVTTNCSNNYGPFQHEEKLIPVIIKKALKAEPIPIYGDGKNIRDWLFVRDHCEALVTVFHTGKSGETYNIGGNTEKNNLEIVHTICSIMDEIRPKDGAKYADLITFVKDRPGHDRRYAIDASKIKAMLNWTPAVNFEDGIKQTIEWYLKKFS